ncbi:MAG: TRAP transporter small permease subunit [Rhodospirillaceae bacterium]
MTRTVERFTSAIAMIGVGGMLIVAVATLGDVLARWLFNAPFEGLEDIRKLVFAVVIASCFPAALAHGQNVTIRFLGKWLGAPATRYLELLGQSLVLFIFAMMALRLQVYAADLVDRGIGSLTYQFLEGPWWVAVAILFWVAAAVQATVVVRCVRAAVLGLDPPGIDNRENAV